ncbi:hypothetical protein AA101099_2663 [Neoasaia chiangmaiensis NBRC 101099]|uniref:Lipopolysaccharide assembly protein A domain-containing protein n=1 Tax=Neoasaia chiangmaiensis TaxID=320497 RepID=A0A1U9KPH9_9PROT|nr:LapA family protein [Neoasaia chiangmaiensis]AQS87675.1 hypothetical protein A0U93_06730 [Neoasaia chiangmaiensis]GBR41885.1 hypothetical protein AA101099_2663 [Neoasaia chiangmaiensis NBRC 101099]
MLRLLVIVLFLVVLITFALSNPDPESLWVVSYGWQLSIGVLTLGVGVASFLIGAFVMWIGELRQRSRARRAESQVRKLESQLIDLHQQLGRYTAATPATATETPAAYPAATPGI